MTRLAPLVSLLALVSANASAAADTAPRKPVGSWVVDFDDAQCVASRDYGTAAEPLTLALKAPPIGNLMQIVLVRPATAGQGAEHARAAITVDGKPPFQTSMVAFSPGAQQRLFRINLPLDQFAAVGSAKSVRISGGGLDYRFELAQMEPLLKIMDKCTQDLRRVWNVGGEGQPARLRQHAVGDLSALLDGDYAAFEIDGLKSGTARVAVLIDEAGRIADCVVVQTSGVAALDAHSCGLMKQRARFRPAVGLDGKPAKDTRLQTVSWEVD